MFTQWATAADTLLFRGNEPAAALPPDLPSAAGVKPRRANRASAALCFTTHLLTLVAASLSTPRMSHGGRGRVKGSSRDAVSAPSERCGSLTPRPAARDGKAGREDAIGTCGVAIWVHNAEHPVQ